MSNLWMSNEIHFQPSGFLNKHNFRYCAEQNPGSVPLYSNSNRVMRRVIVGLHGPLRFEDGERVVVTTPYRYIVMLDTFAGRELKRFPHICNIVWFQQERTTFRSAFNSMELYEICLVAT